MRAGPQFEVCDGLIRRGEMPPSVVRRPPSVLSADVVVLEDAGLLLRKDDDLQGPFCETLKHPRSSCPNPRRNDSRQRGRQLDSPLPSALPLLDGVADTKAVRFSVRGGVPR